MAYTVTINYGAGDVVLTNYSGQNLVYAGSLKKTTQVHSKDFRPVSGQAWFSIQPKAALMSALFALYRDQLITVSIMDGATPWFTGYVRPLTRFKDSTGKTSVDFECVDAGWPLHLKPSVDVQYTPADNMVVCNTSSTSVSLIHQLLADAGFTGSVTAFDILESIGYLRVVNKPFFEVLSDLCFSYHTSFYFDESGGFVLYDWGKTSGSISSSGTVDEDNMLGELSIDRSTEIPDTPVVVYMDQSAQNGVRLGGVTPNVVIAHSTIVSTYSNPIYWAGKVGSKGNMELTNVKTFNIKHAELEENLEGIISKNAVINVIWCQSFALESGIDYIYVGSPRDVLTYPITSTPSTPRFKNQVDFTLTATDSASTVVCDHLNAIQQQGFRIEKIDISASCAYSMEAGRVTGPDVGTGTKEYKARYLYDETLAETLATAISENLKYGEYKYSWRSVENLTVGNYYTVANTLASVSSLVRVTKKTININPSGDIFYEYEGTRYSGFATVTVTADPGYQTDPIIIVEDEEGEVISGPSISESSDVVLGETGLYLTKDKMGYYNATAADWKSVIRNDGTFKFDGDGSSYIEWDGSSLFIAGDMQLSGSSTLAGTITAGEDIKSSNYEAGVSGWTITGNGDAEFNTITVRDEDIQTALVGEVVNDIADFESAVPFWMTVVKLNGSIETTSGEATTASSGYTYSSAQTKRWPLSLFATSGTYGTEFINGQNISETKAGQIFGGFMWLYLSAVGTIDKLIFSIDQYLSVQLTTTSKIAVKSSVTTPGTLATSDAALSTGWRFVVAWIDVDAYKLYISIDGTKETFDISSVTGWSTSTQMVCLARSYNAENSCTTYSSEVGSFVTYDGTDPEPYIERYRTSTRAWNESYKPHAFNISPEINSGKSLMPPGFLIGLEMSNSTDADHDISIAPGKARCSKDRRNIALEEQLIKQIDATWSAGNNAGGLFAGTVTSSQTYHMFIIRKDSDGTIDAGFDTSVYAAYRPSGYTAYRRIGSLKTDSSANILAFAQFGDVFRSLTDRITYDVALALTLPTSYTNITFPNVPTGLNFMLKLSITARAASTSYVAYLGTGDFQYVPASDQNDMTIINAAGARPIEIQRLCSTSAQISYIGNAAVTLENHSIWAKEWVDDRGKLGGL